LIDARLKDRSYRGRHNHKVNFLKKIGGTLSGPPFDLAIIIGD
jgi:hypothetical protein